MGRKADKRAARLAAALDREWWVTAAQCVQMDRQDVAATIELLAQEAGHAVEALVFTTPAIDTAHVAAMSAQPDVKPRSKRGQRTRRWR